MLVTDVLTHVLESHVLSLNSYTHTSMVNGTNGVCVSMCTCHLCVYVSFVCVSHCHCLMLR